MNAPSPSPSSPSPASAFPVIDKNTERSWDQLLDFIGEGRVIPVVGPELLMLDIGGETKLLYRHLAQRLAGRLQIDAQPADTLNSVTCRYLSQGGQGEDIYPELKRVMPLAAEIKLPDTLVKLAQIQPLNLFVTTSFDPLLAYALNQVRYGNQDKTQVLAFSPGSAEDLPVALEQLDRATVFHLFGKLTAVPEYAVTEEDTLEFMHTLQSRSSRPERLFDAMIKQSLLFIGCPMADWLARFFIRIGRRERLIVSSGKTDFMVGDLLQKEANLAAFLTAFGGRTKMFPLASIEFVDELHRRWMALQPAQPAQAGAPAPPDGDRMQNGAVFLSYASEDRPAVVLLRDALEQAGIDVWFDRNPEALRVGENFDTRIKANIDRCCLFIPIISHSTLTQQARYFRTEWNHAQDLAERYPDDKRFILPVAIDDTPPDAPEVPDRFRKLQWQRIQSGQAPPAFIDEIRRLYRDYQRAPAEMA